MRCWECKNKIHWSSGMVQISFYHDNQYVLSPTLNTHTIQKFNTPIKTAACIRNSNDKVTFGIGISYTSYELQGLWQAKNQCVPGVYGDSFCCIIFKICATMAQKRSVRRTLPTILTLRKSPDVIMAPLSFFPKNKYCYVDLQKLQNYMHRILRKCSLFISVW